MVCIWLLTTNGFAQNTIKGDGNIITKEISISDYDEISYVGKVNIEYEQSNASPFFKITIDENILPHLDIKIKGKTLIIQPKDEKKYFNGNSYGLNLQLGLAPSVRGETLDIPAFARIANALSARAEA